MKPKICILSLGAYTLFDQTVTSNIGGAEVQLYQLGLNLQKQGYSVSYIVSDLGQKDRQVFEGVKVIRGLKYYRFVPTYLQNLISFTSILLNMIQERPKIIIQRGAGVETLIMAAAAKFLNVKSIFMTAHVQDCNGLFIKKHYLKGYLYHLGVHSVSKIIVQSYDQQKLLRQTEGLESSVVNTAYPIPVFKKTNKETVLWISRLDHWKRPVVFVDLAKKFPSQSFVMIGNVSIDNPNLDLFRTTLPSNIKYLSYVPFNKIDQYFQNAKVFINTSIEEGFPNTFIQSCLYQTPVISLKVNPDEIITKNGFGYCANDDTELLESYLKKLLDSSKLIEKMGRIGYQYAKSNHNISKIGLQLSKLIESL